MKQTTVNVYATKPEIIPNIVIKIVAKDKNETKEWIQQISLSVKLMMSLKTKLKALIMIYENHDILLTKNGDFLITTIFDYRYYRESSPL